MAEQEQYDAVLMQLAARHGLLLEPKLESWRPAGGLNDRIRPLAEDTLASPHRSQAGCRAAPSAGRAQGKGPRRAPGTASDVSGPTFFPRHPRVSPRTPMQLRMAGGRVIQL